MLIDKLTSVTEKNRVSTNQTILEQHSKDESYHTPVLPDVVVYPTSKEEVQEIVHIAQEQKIPVVPFGIGSSLEGHSIPVHGGISVDFCLMYNIIDIRHFYFLVRVKSGVNKLQYHT